MKQDANKLILETLTEKSKTKLDVFKNTTDTFKLMKKTAKYISQNFRKQLKSIDERIEVEYKDQGSFQFGLRIAGDLIIFVMHSNTFEFDRSHVIWNTPTIKNDEKNSYCGMISMYNFLSDSFKYNRLEDVGYMIGRIFINRNKHFFVEGKRQLGVLYNNFGQEIIEPKTIHKIIQSAILFSLDFDLLVPPYEKVTYATVGQLAQKNNAKKLKTAKRLGFKFYDENEDFNSI